MQKYVYLHPNAPPNFNRFVLMKMEQKKFHLLYSYRADFRPLTVVYFVLTHFKTTGFTCIWGKISVFRVWDVAEGMQVLFLYGYIAPLGKENFKCFEY